MRLVNLAILVLQQIGLVAVKYTGCAAQQACRVFITVQTMTSCLHAEHFHVRIVQKWMKQPKRVRSAADASDQQVRQSPQTVEHLRARFFADHALEIANQLGVGVRASRSADDVECVMHIRDPVTQAFVHCIF